MKPIDNININGPINAVRLKGTINGVDKTLHAFMDYHEDIDMQTYCKNIWSDDFKTYLRNMFQKLKNNGVKYDFFIELDPHEEKQQQEIDEDAQYKGRYTDVARDSWTLLYAYSDSALYHFVVHCNANAVSSCYEWPNISSWRNRVRYWLYVLFS